MPHAGGQGRLSRRLTQVWALFMVISAVLIGWRSIQAEWNIGSTERSQTLPIYSGRRAGAGSEITATGPRSAAAASSEPRPAATPISASLPARLRISKIGVDAAIEPVGLDRLGNVDVPADSNNLGWYELGPAPGAPGNAVIDGHVDWYTGPSVFWRLTEVQAGDPISIATMDGGRLRFRVDAVVSYDHLAHPDELFSASGPPRISLITCTGTWDRSSQIYLQRLVVQASLVGDSQSPGGQHAL